MTARCCDPRCTDGPPEHDEPRPRWAVDGERLCVRCGTLLERRLSELPACRDALRANLAKTGGGSNVGNKPTKGSPPIPLNIAAHDHLTLMQATVTLWALMVREERNLRGPDRNDLRVLCGWLSSQLPWLLTHPAVGDLADEVRNLVRIAEALAQTREQWHPLDPPCPGCGEHAVGRWDGADHIDCKACERVWQEKEYPSFVRLALDNSGGRVTAKEAISLLEVKPELFRQMVSRGKVHKLGTLDGIAQYRASDVHTLVTRRKADAVVDDDAA